MESVTITSWYSLNLVILWQYCWTLLQNSIHIRRIIGDMRTTHLNTRPPHSIASLRLRAPDMTEYSRTCKSPRTLHLLAARTKSPPVPSHYLCEAKHLSRHS